MAATSFLPQEIIRRKRDGAELAPFEIGQMIAGLTDGRVTEGQAAAFAMAVFFRDMNTAERVALTEAMRDSGSVLDWSNLPGPALDKHSTGGVGDTVSLMLAPAVAACGGFVPMISGRGLGHTGGTLDKLDSVPGYMTQPDNAMFRKVVREAGCAIIGQTADLAPADKRLYGIRDVTATVESVPLITASILSKKLAAGLQGLAMDVKTGSGAFMPTRERSRELAQSLVAVANGAGLKTTALITDMDAPLADVAGNALEVRYAIDYLTGARREARMHEVTLALGAEMLVLGNLATSLIDGRQRMERAISSGAAAEAFQRMISALGGPHDLITRPSAHLAAAPVVRELTAPEAGFVSAIDTRAVGIAVVELGGGRARAQDAIDPAVGLTALAGIGAPVGPGRPLAVIHARDEATFARAAARLIEAYGLAAEAVPATPRTIVERITA
ncbi:MAG: thymidine phosphorylase [Hyphomicrobiales bacterium]|nr:thymidine phosphorylase [Hyphomicrobiales bacterium]